DARARRVDVHADAVAGALDVDAGDAGTVEAGLQQVADLDVLGHVVRVTLTRLRAVGEPARHVVGGDSQTEAVGVDLLAHYFPALLLFAAAAPASSSGVLSTTVMWLVRLRILKARPWARGWNRFRVVPSST